MTQLSGTRAVLLDAERVQFLENLGLAFMRAGQNEIGSKLLGIVLAWRVSPEVPTLRTEQEDELLQPDNVVELHGYSKKVGE